MDTIFLYNLKYRFRKEINSVLKFVCFLFRRNTRWVATETMLLQRSVGTQGAPSLRFFKNILFVPFNFKCR